MKTATKQYRKRLYAKYATAQATYWEHDSTERLRVESAVVARRFGRWLPRDQSAAILDLGCGSGAFLVALRSHGYTNLTGVDVSPEAVRIARSKGLRILEQDLLDTLSSRPGTFDVISALDVIEHLEKDEALEFLDLAWSSLRCGGRLILQTPNAFSPWAGHYRYGDLSHEVSYTPGSISSLLRLTGFERIEVREVAPFAHGLASLLRLVSWKFFWAMCAVWNLAEIGCLGGGVYSRNMIVSAVKGADDEGPSAA